MNIATMASNHMKKILTAVDQKYKEFATEPYGQKELTDKEQMALYKSLTPEKLFENIQSMNYGEFQKFNKWLYKMEQKEAKDA